MTPQFCIAALDRALAGAGEDVIVRRTTGTAPSTTSVDVTCRAKVTASAAQPGTGGVVITTYDVIISPTQIRAAGWPGGSTPALPPSQFDQAIPRALTDKIVLRGKAMAIVFVDPILVGNEWVRANIRAQG
ncbi:hypothetical protein ACRAVF_33835 (plasmid) [Bradyrhizobium oligotrophicum S58]